MKIMKFRVWSKEEQQYVEGPLVNGETGMVCGTGTYDIELFSEKKDKNETEIYENDILMRIDPNGEKVFHIVAWRQGALVLLDKNGQIDGLIWNGYNQEVIGNIHQKQWRSNEEIN